MAGHSKWANIKHRKERQDAKKGKIFTKWIRELTVAARSQRLHDGVPVPRTWFQGREQHAVQVTLKRFRSHR